MTHRATIYLSNGTVLGSSTHSKDQMDELIDAIASSWSGQPRPGMITIDGEPRMHFNPAFVAAVSVAQEGDR